MIFLYIFLCYASMEIFRYIAQIVRAEKSFKKGFRAGIEASTRVVATMKYQLELASDEDATDVTLYIRGRINHPDEVHCR